jgi:hypothetical protein
LHTPITSDSPVEQQYFTCFYWSLTSLLRVPYVGPDAAVSQLAFSCFVTSIGAIVFALGTAEIHAIVHQSLGATIARTMHMDQLSTVFSKARTGGIAQRTALTWSRKAAELGRLRGDNKKEQQLVAQLPTNLRSELLCTMYNELLTPDCGLWGRISKEAIGQIASACWPSIFLPRQVLVAAGAMTSEVFILQHGSLRLSGGVAQGIAGRGEETRRDREHSRKSIFTGGDGRRAVASRATSILTGIRGRASVSPGGGTSIAARSMTKAASAFSLPAALPGAEGSRFRILERPGSVVGSVEVGRAPFIIEAIKLSHALVLDAPSVLARMAEVDAHAVRSAINAKQNAAIEYLRYTRRGSTMAPATEPSLLEVTPSSRRNSFVPGKTLERMWPDGSKGSDSFRRKESGKRSISRLVRVTHQTSMAIDQVFEEAQAVALVSRVTMVERDLRALREQADTSFKQLAEATVNLRALRGNGNGKGGPGTPPTGGASKPDALLEEDVESFN